MTSFDSISRRLSLRELRLLLAVARAGSILKAAREIGLTQPAVSKAIADLETTVGVRLFDRNHRGVEPTPQGVVLIRRSRAIFEEMRQAVQELHFLDDAASGEVRVGGTPSVCGGILAHAVALMLAERPGLRHGLIELESEQLLAEVRERAVDFGVGRKPALRADDEIAFEPLFTDRLLVVAGAKHPLAGRRVISADELAAQRWIFPLEGSVVAQHLAAAFERRGVAAPVPSVATMSTLLRYELIATQRFVTVLHGSLMRFGKLPRQMHVLPFDLETSVPIGLILVGGRTLSPAADLLIQKLRALAGTIPAPPKRKRSSPAK